MKSIKFKILVITLFAITTIVLSNPCSWADVIFNDFGPGDTYNNTVGYGLSVGSPVMVDWDQGHAFTPVGTDYFLYTIKLAVGLVVGPNELDIWLMTDLGGKPGAIIESFNFSNAMGYFGDYNPPLVANSLLHPLLSANTQYWLIASTPGPDEWAGWNFNSENVTGPHAWRTDLGAWNVYYDPMAAFSITGTPVPEPTTMILLGSGLIGLAGYGRKKFFKK